MTNLSVDRSKFYRATDTPIMCRFDYVSESHSIEDMKQLKYFSAVFNTLQEGDQIYARDADMQRATFLVESKDQENMDVILSIEQVHNFVPVMREGEFFQYRNLGRLGGHSIIDDTGTAIKTEIRSKQLALELIDELTDSERSKNANQAVKTAEAEKKATDKAVAERHANRQAGTKAA